MRIYGLISLNSGTDHSSQQTDYEHLWENGTAYANSRSCYPPSHPTLPRRAAVTPPAFQVQWLLSGAAVAYLQIGDQRRVASTPQILLLPLPSSGYVTQHRSYINPNAACLNWQTLCELWAVALGFGGTYLKFLKLMGTKKENCFLSMDLMWLVSMGSSEIQFTLLVKSHYCVKKHQTQRKNVWLN